MIRTELSSAVRVALSVRVAARLSTVFFILVQAGCSSDKAFEPTAEPKVEPAVATSLAAISSVTCQPILEMPSRPR